MVGANFNKNSSMQAIARILRGGLMVSVLDLGANGPGSGPGRGHCVVGKTLYSLGFSLYPGV